VHNVKEILKRVQPLSNQPGVGDVVSLLQAYIGVWKDELVDAKAEQIYQLQGAIRKVTDIILEIKRQPINYEYKNGAYNGK